MTTHKLVLKGVPASSGQKAGPAKIVLSEKEIFKVGDGDVLVVPLTNPLYTPAIMKASAIITETGGVLCHAAIVSREIGIPCVVGVKNATKLIKNGQKVLVNGTDGKVSIT